jgi:hypothetical protein
VLIVHSAGDAPAFPLAVDVKAKLDGTGAFAMVDLFNAEAATPTAAELAAYDAVLAFRNEQFANTTELGDRLADYWDAGGRVVVALAANLVKPIGLGGRWASGGYQLLNLTGLSAVNTTSITAQNSQLFIEEPSSPLVVGVTNLTATFALRSTDAPVSGVVVVARWGPSGDPLIIRGVRSGRNLVSLNFFPPSADFGDPDLWVGDGAAIMRNALLF